MLGVRDGGPLASIAARVGRDANSSMEAFDNGRGCPDFDRMLAKPERDTVVAIVELDVVVDVGARELALGELEPTKWQRFHARPVEGFEGFAPRARQFLKASRIELFEQ